MSPRRTIPAVAWVWGVDTGSLRCGFGFAAELDPVVAAATAAWRDGREDTNLSQSLRECYSTVHARAVELARRYPPCTVIVEQATGRHRNPSLIYHGGVTMLALAHATGLNPWAMVVPTWKRNHREDGTDLETKANLLPWGERLGLGSDLDELAGVAIALAGRKVWNGLPTTRVSRAGTTVPTG